MDKENVAIFEEIQNEFIKIQDNYIERKCIFKKRMPILWSSFEI